MYVLQLMASLISLFNLVFFADVMFVYKRSFLTTRQDRVRRYAGRDVGNDYSINTEPQL